MLTYRSAVQRTIYRHRVAAAAVPHCALSSKAPTVKDEEEEAKPPVTVSGVEKKVERARIKNPHLILGPYDDNANLPAATVLPEKLHELKYMDPADLTNVAARRKMDGTERTVIIRQETKSARQNPFNHEGVWHIQMSEDGTQSESSWINSLMGWTSSADPYQSQQTMTFTNAAEAVHFAKKRGWKYEVKEPIMRVLVNPDVQYQDNFLPQKIARQVKEEGTQCRHWERKAAGTSHYFRQLKYHGDGTVRQHGPNRDAKVAPTVEGYYKRR